MADSKRVIAAFDFDGTVTRRDTLLPFLLQLHGLKLLFSSIPLLPVLLGYALRIISNSRAKERVLKKMVGGMSEFELKMQAERFAAEVLPGKVKPEALARLQWHRARGDRCVLISASIEHYVRPWGRSAGFDDVIATKLEVSGDGIITGRYDGANCYGPEKMRRLFELFGDREDIELYAYGDSGGDRELLASADHAWYREMPADEGEE